MLFINQIRLAYYLFCRMGIATVSGHHVHADRLLIVSFRLKIMAYSRLLRPQSVRKSQ